MNKGDVEMVRVQPDQLSAQYITKDGSRREVNLIPNVQIEDQLFNQLAEKKVRGGWMMLDGCQMVSMIFIWGQLLSIDTLLCAFRGVCYTFLGIVEQIVLWPQMLKSSANGM